MIISTGMREWLRDRVLEYTYFFPHLSSFLNIFMKNLIRVKGLYNRYDYVHLIRFATFFSSNNDNIIVIVIVAVVLIIIIIMNKLLAKAGCCYDVYTAFKFIKRLSLEEREAS